MLGERERKEIARLWERKVRQDALNLPQAERHRNLEPPSAEFICALAAGVGAKRILEIGGSSGLSTIALAAAARQVSGPFARRDDRRRARSVAAAANLYE